MLNRRSISGICAYFGDTLVSWSSRKQKTIARSRIEVEYWSLAHLASEIGFQAKGIPTLWYDNLSANALVTNLVCHARSKNIQRLISIIFVSFGPKESIIVLLSPSHSRFWAFCSKLKCAWRP